MAVANVARNVKFQSTIMGSSIPVDVNIQNTYKATIDFTLFGTPYTFTIETWARRGLVNFLDFFHEFTPRDVAQFGLRTEDVNGLVNYYEDNTDIVLNPDGSYTIGSRAKAMTQYQKLNCVEQGCRDIIICLEQIGSTHRRSMMEYAVWYRELHQGPTDYSAYITLQTCQSIVHNNFMAPNVTWALVQFE